MTVYDQTEFQSDDERSRAKELSLQSSTPPVNVSGYSIEQFIGSGAYGEVWSGTEKKTGRRVAIKFYTRGSRDDIDLLAREVEKLVALSADRYAVQLLDVDWQAEVPYFVMDYFERGSLEDLLKKGAALPVAQAEDIFSEIAAGLINLHGKGIFHCDLKPGNVLLGDDEKPRLADFGQARLTTEKAPSLGTLFFMAPEQADLDAVPAAKWDVYALGAIMYCMLVGKPPYHSEQLTEKIESSTSVEERLEQYKKSLSDAPRPVEHRGIAGVDKALADIIDRMIEVNPNRRFDSVQSVMFAMRQRELAKARKPLLVLGIVGPLLLSAVMALFSWFAYQRAYEDTKRAVDTKAKESNEFAARLAAESVASKIEEYFRAVRELAMDEKFRDDLETAILDTEVSECLKQLDDPNNNSDSAFDELRSDFRDNLTRMRLQGYLEKRMNRDSDGFYPDAASWFVNDVRGNQLASVFQVEPENKTIGKNYSYRTYFTGLNRDQKKTVDGRTEYPVAPRDQPRLMIDRPHLSAIFRSRGTSTWKVAFSVPIFDLKNEAVIGIVACTSEMGHFVEFQNAVTDKGVTQYATLIDLRDGDYSGAILEHPIFHELETDPADIPRAEDVDRVSITNRFVDPIGNLEQGSAYKKEWIAAVQPVRTECDYASSLRGEDGTEELETGLFVLVAEEYAAVIEPVSRLSDRLIELALMAGMFLLVVVIAVWWFVLSMLKESNRRLVRSFAGAADSTYRTGSGTSGTS